MRCLGLFLFCLVSGNLDQLLVIFMLIFETSTAVLLAKVNAGGSDEELYSPHCVFGPFGIVMNTSGDCHRSCPPGQEQVLVNYENVDICCCN